MLASTSYVIGSETLSHQCEINPGLLRNAGILGAIMSRPVPVALSAILLGLFAALQLLGAAGMAAFGVVLLHKGLPNMPPGPMPFAPSFIPVLFFAFAIIHAALAVWFIWTLVGLVRLRSWARWGRSLVPAPPPRRVYPAPATAPVTAFD